MDIGEEQAPYILEPLEDPVPPEVPAQPVEEPVPVAAPA